MVNIKVILAVAASGFAILFWTILAYRIITYGVQPAAPGHVPYFWLAVLSSLAGIALWVWVWVARRSNSDHS